MFPKLGLVFVFVSISFAGVSPQLHAKDAAKKPASTRKVSKRSLGLGGWGRSLRRPQFSKVRGARSVVPSHPKSVLKLPLKVSKPPKELVERLKLDPFYKKYVSANGFPVLGSSKVSDYALLEAAYLVNMMLAKRDDVRKALIDNQCRLVVMAYNEFTSDIPEHNHLKPHKFWDRRARGLGGSRKDPVASCAEENMLCFPGDPYSTENILIHEFAHLIHLNGMTRIDNTFDKRLRDTYNNAIANGLWKGKYAANNKNEYFAEGVQSWFDNNRQPDHDHNHVDTRKELIEYDPGLAKLCKEVFGETELKYVKPIHRKKLGHLEGYDFSKSPRFRWPKGLEEWYRNYQKQKKAKKRRVPCSHALAGEHVDCF